MSRPKINLQNLTNSRLGIGFALWLGRSMTPWLGYRLADWLARLIASRRNSAFIRTLRANQWVATGEKLSGRDLDLAVLRVLRTNGRFLYDFYHTINQPDEILRMVEFPPDFRQIFDRLITGEEGALFIAPHLGNFDLGGKAMALNGLHFQVLSYPNPTSGYQWQNEIRQQSGIEMTPMSIESLRKARERLRNRGVVLTGMDRPLAETRYHPRFFHRPSMVPVAYVRLALQEQVPVYVVACVAKPHGGYRMQVSPAFHLQPHPDKEVELVQNAEQLLAQAEEWIRKMPEQWMMFYPVWQEILSEKY